MYQRNFHKTQTTYERGGGRKLVNTAGYIPAKDQIENMILAGERLASHRQELYFEDKEKDPFKMMPSPVTRTDFDMIDAHIMANEIQNKADQLIDETRNNWKKQKEEQKAKNVEKSTEEK